MTNIMTNCTIGAKVFPDQRTTILFKNKDLRQEGFVDTLHYDDTSFGPRGLDFATNNFVGYSIGVNKYGVACCNAHIATTSATAYDVLTEKIVAGSRTVEEAVDLVEREIRGGAEYQWCNMVVADLSQVAAIEVTAADFAVETSSTTTVRTNHQLLLDEKPEGQQWEPGFDWGSQQRLAQAKRMLEGAKGYDDVVRLLRWHSQGRGTASICRHRVPADAPEATELETVYSYIVEIRRVEKDSQPQATFHVAKGQPCQNQHVALPLKFPSTPVEREGEGLLARFPGANYRVLRF
ncbi:MAG: hypothetical protein ACE5NP_04285 [Anaerolineae bacterium]